MNWTAVWNLKCENKNCQKEAIYKQTNIAISNRGN